MIQLVESAREGEGFRLIFTAIPHDPDYRLPFRVTRAPLYPPLPIPVETIREHVMLGIKPTHELGKRVRFEAPDLSGPVTIERGQTVAREDGLYWEGEE